LRNHNFGHFLNGWVTPIGECNIFSPRTTLPVHHPSQLSCDLVTSHFITSLGPVRANVSADQFHSPDSVLCCLYVWFMHSTFRWSCHFTRPYSIFFMGRSCEGELCKRLGEMWGSIMEYGLLWRESTLLAACSNERVMIKHSSTVYLFHGAEPKLVLTNHMVQVIHTIHKGGLLGIDLPAILEIYHCSLKVSTRARVTQRHQ